ncbi:MAG: transcription antitermination factor NusB [Lachnospiraceae bacterium]|nr:transcription antitermination factor NusB [Lachnospiraceae bacterium]
MTKHDERVKLFQLIFNCSFYENSEIPEQMDLFRRLQMASEQESFKTVEEKAKKVLDKLGDIDMILTKASTGWPLSRLGKAELAIMRLAAYEILFDESVPAGVAINEAVEISKVFGNDSAPSFVNAVLAKLVNEPDKQ